MNEQIKLLCEQVAKITQGASWEEQTKFMEKFAELIVRECADLVDNVLEQGSPPNPTVGEQLVKHFGVEE